MTDPDRLILRPADCRSSKLIGWLFIACGVIFLGLPMGFSFAGARGEAKWLALWGIFLVLTLLGLLMAYGQTVLVADRRQRTISRQFEAIIPLRRVTRRWAEFNEIVLAEDPGYEHEVIVLRLIGPQHTFTWQAQHAALTPLGAAVHLAEFMDLPLRDETRGLRKQVR